MKPKIKTALRRKFWERYDADPKFRKRVKTAMTKNLNRAVKQLKKAKK